MSEYKNKEVQSFLSNNFCRVFELPEQYPSDFCFGGGHSVDFKMVDWFYPIPDPHMPYPDDSILDAAWEEIENLNREFIKNKDYIKPGKKYLVITDFNKSFFV